MSKGPVKIGYILKNHWKLKQQLKEKILQNCIIHNRLVADL